MADWFEVKIKYAKIAENGAEKIATENYLVDAISYSEAEERISKEMTDYLGNEFQVANIKRANFTDVFPFDGGDKWYKAKVVFITFDEEKGIEQRKCNNMLVQSADINDALHNLKDALKDMTVDYEISIISETLIMDIFPYFTGEVEDREISRLKIVDEFDEKTAESEEI